ncbi:MAG: hypothetical protein M3P51_00295 [Chloroflexota bacterium]|nr:hypothetical protein [Chloroflexota bacterium]
MSKVIIGFDRALRPEWLDLAAATVLRGDDRTTAQDRLTAELRSDISAPEALEKTVRVILRIWHPEDAAGVRARDEAATLIGEVDEAERLSLHWGLTVLAYPFFRHIASVVGRLSRLEPTFSVAQVHKRLVGEYGDTALVERARRHVIRTLTDWGMCESAGQKGVYRVAPQRTISDLRVQRWLLQITLQANETEARQMDGLIAAPEMFPWDFSSEIAQIVRDERFETAVSGDGRRTVTLASA